MRSHFIYVCYLCWANWHFFILYSLDHRRLQHNAESRLRSLHLNIINGSRLLGKQALNEKTANEEMDG